MAAVSSPPDDVVLQNSWGPQEDQSMGPVGNGQPANGVSMPVDDRNAGQDPEGAMDYPPRGSSVGDASVTGSKDNYRGEKQVKPNKVYIGGLPENTREEDLQNCFGKIGKIANIELKVGYGFVEFESREAAEESVAKYHEGYFMGQKIRVELSHGGGRTAKYAGEPGACFRCGQQGHWARECPNQSASGAGVAAHRSRNDIDGPLIDRIQRDYPPRSAPSRDDYTMSRYPPARDARYDYAPPPQRDYRRPPSPREYRDYPPPPPRGREYDDYRRAPPPPPVHDRDRYALPPPPPADYGRGRYPPPPPESYRGYSGAPPPPQPANYDRYDRRPADRYPPSYPAPPPTGGRARTPPPREYDRAPPRDYHDYRGRPPTPPRYPPSDYPRASAEPPRYRRRSVSPVVRSPGPYDMYPTNGYSGNVQSAPRREYPVPPRSGRDIEPAPYRRQ